MALLEGPRGLEVLRRLENRGAVFSPLSSPPSPASSGEAPAVPAGGAALLSGTSGGPGGQAGPAGEAAPAPAPAPGGAPALPGDLLVALEVDWREGAESRPERPAAARRASLSPEHVAYAAVRILCPNERLAAEGLRRRQLEERVASVEKEQQRPIAIVVKEPLVLEAGLKAVQGRSMAYLDSLDSSLWQSVFYLACKYGARLAVRLEPLPLRPGEGGGGVCIPAILRLFEAAREYSLASSDLYVDPLGFDEAGAPSWDRLTIDAVLRQMPWAKRETGVRWILGCHHFREDSGHRAVPSAASQSEILSIALFQGLDAVILGSDQPHLIETLSAHQGWDAGGGPGALQAPLAP
jgi:hypothetical protein